MAEFLSEEMLVQRARIQVKRVAELEYLVKEFIQCVENADVQNVWDEGYVDLVYTYEAACVALGKTPQEHDENEYGDGYENEYIDIEDEVFGEGE